MAKFPFHAGGVAAVGITREVGRGHDAKCSEVSHGLHLGLAKQEGAAPQLMRARAVFVFRFQSTMRTTIGFEVLQGVPIPRDWSARGIGRWDLCTIERSVVFSGINRKTISRHGEPPRGLPAPWATRFGRRGTAGRGEKAFAPCLSERISAETGVLLQRH